MYYHGNRVIPRQAAKHYPSATFLYSSPKILKSRKWGANLKAHAFCNCEIVVEILQPESISTWQETVHQFVFVD